MGAGKSERGREDVSEQHYMNLLSIPKGKKKKRRSNVKIDIFKVSESFDNHECSIWMGIKDIRLTFEAGFFSYL